MSVINSVLRDLESRRAAPADRDQLPDGLIATTPTPVRAPGHQGRYLLWGLLLLVSAGLAYLVQNSDALQFYSLREPPLAQPPASPLNSTPPLVAIAPPTPVPATPVLTSTPEQTTTAPAPAQGTSGSIATPSAAAPATPPPAIEPPRPAAPAALPARNAVVVSGREDKASPRKAPATLPASAAAARAASRPEAAASNSGEALKTVSPRQRAQALYNQAQQSLANGRSTPAKAILEEALAADPSFAEARQLLASLQAESGQNDAAETTLAGGLAYTPPPPLVLALARLRLARAGDEAGFRLLMEYQHTAKDSADYQAFLGTLLLQRKQWAEAGHRYANALRLNPRPGAWWAGYGLALFGTQQYTEAQNALAHAKQQGGLAPALLDVVNERLGDLKRLLADKEQS